MTLHQIQTVDYHTGGEPFRIVEHPPVAIDGPTVAERRMFAMRSPDVDGLRRLLCFEPRGHADMYGGFLTPPDDDGADFGVLFWHKDGFSTACGHGTIALGVWAVQAGRVPVRGDVTDVIIDVPSGRVTARVHCRAGEVTSVDFVNVASYLIASDVAVETSRGAAQVDVGFGGAIYAQVRASDLGLSVAPEHLADLISVGREIKWTLNDEHLRRTPERRPPRAASTGRSCTTTWAPTLRATCTSATSRSMPTAQWTGHPAARVPQRGSPC